MKLFFLFILISIYSLSYSQKSNLVVFSEDNEQFKLYINNIQQTPDYFTNVKITEISSPNCKMRILFKNKKLKPIDKNIFFQTQGNEETYIIKKVNNKYIVRFVSSNKITDNKQNIPEQKIYVYSKTPRITDETGIQDTTTYKTDSITHIKKINTDSIKTKCKTPMLDTDFLNAKKTIENQDFESDKIIKAKQIIDKNCLLSTQVKQIIQLFDFDDSRLEIAKYAYIHTFDTSNYNILYNVFEFNSTITNLKDYISTMNK